MYYQLKAKLLKIRLAIAGEDIFKKNKINRDLDKDTAGNNFEQDLLDMITESVDSDPAFSGDNARKVSEAFKKRKKGKGGTTTFTIKS